MREILFSTSRLYFSIWNENDICSAYELWGNPEVTKYITASGRMSEEQTFERLNREIETYKNCKIQYWPIFLTSTNELVGCCGLRPHKPEENILEMGIHLKNKFWKQGLATEACSIIIKYAFDKVGVNGLFAGHNPKNTASAKLLKKLGFKYTHDEFYSPTGLMHPSYIMTKYDRT